MNAANCKNRKNKAQNELNGGTPLNKLLKISFLPSFFTKAILVCKGEGLFLSFMTRALPGVFILMPLVSRAESVKNAEVQWALCEPSVTSFQKKTHANMGNSETYDTYYMETPDLDLMGHSAMIRIRVKGHQAKSSVKVNYSDDQNLPWGDLQGTDSKCEWDRYSQYQKVGCSMSNKSKDFSHSISTDQERYLNRAAGFTNLDQLMVLGPVQGQTWEWGQRDLNLDLSLEEIKGPESYYSLELSARVPVAETDKVSRKVSNWLNEKGLTLCAVQAGKSENLIKALLKKYE